MVVPNKRKRHSSSSLWALKTLSLSPSPSSATASARPRQRSTAQSATTAMAPSSVECVCATRVAWGRTASAQRATTTPVNRTAAAGQSAPEDHSRQCAVAAATACAVSAFATAVTLARCGESCASATTSTACVTRATFAQVGKQQIEVGLGWMHVLNHGFTKRTFFLWQPMVLQGKCKAQKSIFFQWKKYITKLTW